MSNTERQRRFRERHPGYYARLHGRKRASEKAELARHIAAIQAAAAAAAAATPEPLALPARPQPLLLPAPVKSLEIPGMTIPVVGGFASMRVLSPLPVSSQATTSQTTIQPLAASRG